jgi:hypothetical protein
MLVTDDFVYLHVPKTGGGTIRDVLESVLPLGYVRRGPRPHVHPGWRHIPEEAAELPVFCHVRNPWDWYVSWYEFGRRQSARRTARLWHSAFADEPDFPTFLGRACRGGLDHDVPEIANLMRAGLDFYTSRWMILVGGVPDEQLHVGRFERLFEDLEAFLGEVGAPVGDDFARRAAEVPGVHVGERGPYRDYYDDRTRRLVRRSCSYFVERFGYRF